MLSQRCCRSCIKNLRRSLSVGTGFSPFVQIILALLIRQLSFLPRFQAAYGECIIARRFTMGQGKHRLDFKQSNKIKRRKPKPVVEGSGDDVLSWEIQSILRTLDNSEAQDSGIGFPEAEPLSFSRFKEVTVDINVLNSSGECLIDSFVAG
jgi:hypothetical protein